MLARPGACTRRNLVLYRTPIVRVKPGSDSTDADGVKGFSEITWILLTAISGFGVLQMLRTLAIRVRNEVAVHDLNAKVAHLKANRVEQLMLRHGMVLKDDVEETPTAGDENATTPETPEADAGEIAAEPERQAA